MACNTLEGVCHYLKAKGRNLVEEIKALRDAEAIEARLYDWADALRLVGNEAAHDVGVEVTQQDAADVPVFARKMLEYVYAFRAQFDDFRARRAKRLATAASTMTKPAT